MIQFINFYYLLSSYHSNSIKLQSKTKSNLQLKSTKYINFKIKSPNLGSYQHLKQLCIKVLNLASLSCKGQNTPKRVPHLETTE